jgi:hypothetical protein
MRRESEFLILQNNFVAEWSLALFTPLHPDAAAVEWRSIPERIVQHRSTTNGVSTVKQGLTKWSNLPLSLST